MRPRRCVEDGGGGAALRMAERPQDARTLTRGDGSEDDSGGGAGH